LKVNLKKLKYSKKNPSAVVVFAEINVQNLIRLHVLTDLIIAEVWK